MANPTPPRWTIADSLETYSIRHWGAGYFGINEKGNVITHPGGPDSPSFDLKELVDDVRRRGISLPPLIAEVARKTGIAPRLGIRVRLSSRGAGKWEASGGDRSKFGLSAAELMQSISFMKETGLLSTFELLHFHLGSQISNIRNVKNA